MGLYTILKKKRKRKNSKVVHSKCLASQAIKNVRVALVMNTHLAYIGQIVRINLEETGPVVLLVQ